MVTQNSPKIKVVPNSKFYNFALITILKFGLRFKNASLKSNGDTLRIYPFSNYFNFFITTLKTLKTNFVHIDKLYTFPFRLNPKMCLDFELGFPG